MANTTSFTYRPAVKTIVRTPITVRAHVSCKTDRYSPKARSNSSRFGGNVPLNY